MAIYHLEAKVVSRGVGRSACAAAAYMSCSAIYNDYDCIQHDYTRKQGLVWQQVFLPEYAPAEWQDRAVLWNAVEETEKTKDSRLAREFVVALPIELGKDEWQSLISDFIREQFVSDGMCADCAIHNTDGHNPHAHILLTVRPLDEHGKWQYKTEKEYLCVRDGEERGFTASEFKAAQADGWEKQYPYYVDKKKKEYLPPSEAEARGLERADKHPKSTKFGRQNPITERWNSDEQLVLWRSAWADTVNRALGRSGIEERIDHRSHAERGLNEQPTVHEGVEARAMERKGFVSDRCELNRQIKADNALLRELKATVKKLLQTVKNTIPAIAEAMERLRMNMTMLRYRILGIGKGRKQLTDYMEVVKPEYERYTGIIKSMKEKKRERKSLVAEKKETPIYQVQKLYTLSKKITELTEELEELRSEKEMLLNTMQCDESGISGIKKDLSKAEVNLKKLDDAEQRYKAELENAYREYAELQESAKGLDSNELLAARLELRQSFDAHAASTIQQIFGSNYDWLTLRDSRQYVSDLLHESDLDLSSVQKKLRQTQRESRNQDQEQPRQRKPKDRDYER
jgi:hypothetical protein